MTTSRPASAATRTPPAQGTYTMFCALANHEELGMRGTLTVG